MKKQLLLVMLAIMLAHLPGVSQSWTTINSSRGNFSFSFPASASPYDTLSVLSYNYVTSDTVAFQVNYIASAAVMGNADLNSYLEDVFGFSDPNSFVDSTATTQPCYIDSIEAVLVVYATMYQLSTNATIEGFMRSDYSTCNVRGKELTLRYPSPSGDSTYCFAFTRYFYWNSKFLAFTVSGPEAKLSELYAYKNSLFSSIYLY